MKKQMITESELAQKVSSLKEKLANEAWYNPATWGGGNTGGGAAFGNPKVAAQGQKAGATQAQGASTTPVAKPAGQPDPNVKALQDKLIAAGAKIKADGIMGPATRAAQAQFPNVTTQTDAEKAAAGGDGAGMVATPADAQAAATPAPAPAAEPAPAAAPAKAADGGPPPTPEQLKWLGGADQTDPIILARMRSAVPNAPATAPAQTPAPATAPASQGAAAAMAAPVKESVGYDEVQRLVSLVQFR